MFIKKKNPIWLILIGRLQSRDWKKKTSLESKVKIWLHYSIGKLLLQKTLFESETPALSHTALITSVTHQSRRSTDSVR